MLPFNPIIIAVSSTNDTLLGNKIFYEAKDVGADIVYGGSADKESLRMEPTIVLVIYHHCIA